MRFLPAIQLSNGTRVKMREFKSEFKKVSGAFLTFIRLKISSDLSRVQICRRLLRNSIFWKGCLGIFWINILRVSKFFYLLVFLIWKNVLYNKKKLYLIINTGVEVICNKNLVDICMQKCWNTVSNVLL